MKRRNGYSLIELVVAMAILTIVVAGAASALMQAQNTSISGRGTVVTGRIERGKIKVGEEVEIVGFRETRKTVVTGRRN